MGTCKLGDDARCWQVCVASCSAGAAAVRSGCKLEGPQMLAVSCKSCTTAGSKLPWLAAVQPVQPAAEAGLQTSSGGTHIGLSSFTSAESMRVICMVSQDASCSSRLA